MVPAKAAGKKRPKLVVHEANPLRVVDRVRGGLPYAEFRRFQQASGLSVEKVAKLAGVSKTSLMRRRKGGKLSREESAALVRLERLFAKAEETFEDEALAKAWLQRANPALEGKPPLDFADTEVGARQVEEILLQLEHGVF